ncbi:PD-(D/E)XK nuclease family protein [Achromobacter xylosoxidans]
MQEQQGTTTALRITLGLHIEQWQGPHPGTSLGRATVGRQAFLAMLETWLGLSSLPVSLAERTAAFLLALRQSDGPGRFFHDSLAADEIGTAARLLQWRDEWILGGWTGAAGAGWPPRLSDMAAVEAAAAGLLPPGEGDRLIAVLRRLDERSVPVGEIVLLEDCKLFPSLWRRLLARFPVVDGSAMDPAAEPHTQLGCLQRAVSDAVSLDQSFTARPDIDGSDGSIVVLRPHTCETAEQWLAHHYHAGQARMLLVSEQHGASVDDTLRVNGAPACGFDESSALRPALLALPLIFETFWDPLEPARLLDFLMHPIGPFRASARRALGAVFAEHPGIGGTEWVKARERLLAETPPEFRAELEQHIRCWLESPRHPRAVGAPIDYAIDRVKLLAQALRGRLLHLMPTDAVARDLGAALGQCAGTLSGLQSLQRDGVKHVKPRLLEQLCAQATTACGNSLAVAEAACMLSATTPEACALGPVAEVIWWMPSTPKLPAGHPWSRPEIEALAAGGVELVNQAFAMGSLAALWMRPLLTAADRLILVLPPAPAEDHPAWQLINLLAPALVASQLEEHPMVRDHLGTVAPLPLQRAQGVWELDTDAPWRATYPLPTRLPSQSYTSLDLHFNNPAIAVLKYAAGLRTGRATVVAKDGRLLGNLAHRLVETLFINDDAPSWSQARLEAWLEPELARLLEQEGMPLLAPGNSAALFQFKSTMRHGLWVLLQHMAHAGAVRVEAERPLAGMLGALRLNGATDLLLHLADGRTAALDLKWTGAKRYRQALSDGTYLQLALYGEMIRQELGALPAAVGYFTFREALLLTATPDVFGPQARVISAKNGVNASELVMQARATWDWRVRQWQKGHVDVIGKGLYPEPGPSPEGCLPLGETAPWHGDYTALFGCRE